MKKLNIIYWIVTILFAAFMAFSAIPDIMINPDAVKFINSLGYPLYFLPFIGIAKVLGSITILVPRFPRLTEWAYAGLMYDLIGAMYSIMCSMGIAAGWMMLLFIAFGALSYALYHRRRKLMAITDQPL